jgi:hypothetical protein
MEPLEERNRTKHRRWKSPGRTRTIFPALAFILFLAAAPARAALDTGSAIGFFTNVAPRLLRTDLNLEFGQIQIYPTNQYTPAVHRLLQVTANLYEATTNRADLTDYPYLPHVYRPIFRRGTNDDIFIVGYREVRDAQIAGIGGSAPAMLDLQDSSSRSAIPLLGTPYDPDASVETDEPMIYGIPLVIGAKKGFPNFNKFGLQNDIQVVRKLQFRKPPGGMVNQTNQVFALSILNLFGAQAWNSYSNAYPRPLQVIVAADATLSLTNEYGQITNQLGSVVSNSFWAANPPPLIYTTWTGYLRGAASAVSFKVPLFTNNLFLTNSFYVQDGTPGGTHFVSSQTAQWDAPNTYQVPHFWLNLRTRLRFIIVETNLNRIVDYVNLDAAESPLDIMEAVRNGAACDQTIDSNTTDGGLLWCTNRLGDPVGTLSITNPSVTTYGILNQMLICLGAVDVPASFWRNFSLSGDKGDSVTKFVEWFVSTNSPNSYDAPFQPTRTLYQYVSWEANDPLVHYTVPDLTDLLVVPNKLELDVPNHSSTNNLSGQNRLNRRYLPWPTIPSDYKTSPTTQFATEVKDPLIRNSDSWTFPAGETLSFANLGNIHRGTPWQTIYLKSSETSDVDNDRWSKWSGNANLADAVAARPMNDWHLVNLFDLLVNTNSPHQRLSINTADTNAWLAALDGLSILTNGSPDSEIIITSNSPEAALVVDGINRTRASQPAGFFHSVGDILATPELTMDSPWLNTNALQTIANTLTDTACESLASQLLPLLRADSFGAITRTNGAVRVQFTGYDGFPCTIETSPDFLNWTSVSTNYPVDGEFHFDLPPSTNAQQFYRSRW